ncbi:MAG: tetratricopeptide repeat protein, partial [Planctomycetota bacterium]|nr:tetratricopeptide repeat protein [Planctomycetota bacterium]
AQPQAAVDLLALAKDTLWPVVADKGGDICQQSSVRGWPVTLVLRPDGLEVARIEGAPENLTLRLAPYLAAQQAKPATRPADPDVVGDSRDRHVIWQIHHARRFLADAQPQAAVDLLAQALKAWPDSVPLRLAMIDALTDLKRGPQALQAIDALPAGSIPPGRLSLLRGKALLVQGQLEPAKAALASALQSDPALAEAHYVLGLVYEQGKDYQRAAQEFHLFHDAQKQ